MNNQPYLPISFFNDVRENDTSCSELSYEEFLTELSEAAADTYAEKSDAPLFASCEFKDGRRNKANVLRSGLVMLDIDEGMQMNEAAGVFSDVGLAGFAYTTASHTMDHHKFRIGIPLSENVDATTYTRAWCALNRLFHEVADRSKRGAESLFYVPGIVAGKEPIFLTFDGDIFFAKTWIEAVGRPEDEELISGSAPKAKAGSACRTKPAASVASAGRSASIYDSKLVSPKAMDAYLDAAGDWHHARYAFMCSVAARASRRGIILTPVELREIFNQIDLIDGGHYQSGQYQRALQLSGS